MRGPVHAVFAAIAKLIRRVLGIEHLAAMESRHRIVLANLARLLLLQQGRYLDKRALASFGFKVYSQADEDGFIHEIFRRIGSEHRTFLEIGVSDGRECNTRLLMRYGWRGCWIDGSSEYAEQIQKVFGPEIGSGQLNVICSLVTLENVGLLVADTGLEGRLDLLSIDIDGNDYHILKELRDCNPRLIVLEYNPIFAPPVEWVMDYNPSHTWDGSDWYGASLKSFEVMLGEKGYELVGCTLNGNNAFFVRRDLLGDHFVPNGSAEIHFEPQRFWLTCAFTAGHPTDPTVR